MSKSKYTFLPILAIVMVFCQPENRQDTERISISGVYPHLAMFNDHLECGQGGTVSFINK